MGMGACSAHQGHELSIAFQCHPSQDVLLCPSTFWGSPPPQQAMLTHSGDGSGVGEEAPGVDGGETPAIEDAGSEAHHLLEALLDAPHPAALLKDHLAEKVILPKGEGGDEVGPVEGT